MYTALKTQTTREWAQKLDRHTGAGYVPMDVARALWAEGAITAQPRLCGSDPTIAMVRLRRR